MQITRECAVIPEYPAGTPEKRTVKPKRAEQRQIACRMLSPFLSCFAAVQTTPVKALLPARQPERGFFITSCGRYLCRELEALLSVPGYDLFLLIVVEVDEVVAVACDTDQQSAVILRMSLCFAQRLLVYDIELDMVPAKLEV